MLQKLLAEVILVAKSQIVRNLLDAYLVKTVKIGHCLSYLKVQYILVDGFSEGSLKLVFCRFDGYVHHMRQFFIPKEFFRVFVYDALYLLSDLDLL